MKEIELEELVGTHMLSGVDETTENISRWGGEETEQVNVFRFILDGKTYKALENPDDGYRSSMDKLVECDEKVSHTFPPQQVVCKMKESDVYEHNDVLQCVDVNNGKVILEVGTGNTDDYYPYFVSSFYPEDLSVNENF